MSTIRTRAAEFLWNNARLLERQRFAFHFLNAPRDGVISALLAYQNPDGGFGNALEPDQRGPDSQPVPVQHALEVLDAVGWDDAIAARACDFLSSIQTAEHGVPFVLPTAHDYPRAPWWQAEEPLVASLNPTAALVGLLLKHHVTHPWVADATAYCWDKIDAMPVDEMHQVGVVITFLRYAPDRERADATFQRLMQRLLDSGLIADLNATDYVRKPLDWAPTPNHPCRPYFSDDLINANLDQMIAEQQDDGGWQITWTPPSPASQYEWRGWVTLQSLLTLQAYQRLN